MIRTENCLSVNLLRINKNQKGSDARQITFQGSELVLPSQGHYNHLLVKPQAWVSFKGISSKNAELVAKACAELEKLQQNPAYDSISLRHSLQKLDDQLGCKGFDVLDLDALTSESGVKPQLEIDPLSKEVVQHRDIENLSDKKIITLHSGIDVNLLKQNPKKLEKLINTLNVMKAASEYKPTVKSLGDYSVVAHNNVVAEKLSNNYSPEQFKALFDFCDEKGTFNLNIDKATGLPKTSDIEDGENWEMGARFWVTDTCRNVDLMKKEPENRAQIPNAITTMGKFYVNQQDAFDKIIESPELYTPYKDMEDKSQSFSYKGKVDPMIGVGHIFLPDTLNEDPSWFNRRRLESIGLFLKTSTESIMAGMGEKENWGFNKALEVPNEVIESIATTAKYLEAIDYPYAPSAGNWEEIPLAGGLTWDTESIKEGFKNLRKLLYSKQFDGNKEIQVIRDRLLDAKYGDLLADKNKLNQLVKAGEDRINKYSTQEAPGRRDHDASLSFVTHSKIENKNSLETIDRNFKILDSIESTIVRDNGITRYSPFNFELSNGEVRQSPDSYLTYGYEVAVTPDGKISLEMGDYKDSFGAKDCSDPEVFAARSKLSPGDEHTAQWFMVSDISKGYGVQLEKLLELYEKSEDKATKEQLMPKIKKAYQKETEFINRAYGRITGSNNGKGTIIKANGEECDAFRIPEAYMSVPNLDGGSTFLPGTNTPLTWAETSLYGASEQYYSNLQDLERLNLKAQVE